MFITCALENRWRINKYSFIIILHEYMSVRKEKTMGENKSYMT